MKHDRNLTFSHTRASHAGVFARASETGVFVDADNLSAQHADRILREGGHSPRLLRAYGNAATAQGWDARHAFQFIHTGIGKNASDIALAVDATEAAHGHSLKRILICSSDGDFRHLALKLRALGKTVVGMGESKTPSSFRSACSDWITLGAKEADRDGKCGPLSDDAICERLRSFIATHSKGGQGVAISRINEFVMMKLALEDCTARTRWRDCLNQENRFAFDKGNVAGVSPSEPMVRFLPSGFAPS